MRKVGSVLAIMLLSITSVAQAPRLVLLDGTPIKMRTTTNLSSHDSVKGDNVSFEVTEDVYVGDVLVIKKGAVAIGTVTDAQHKRSMGRQGKLDITIDYVRLVDGEKAQLRGTKQGAGGGHTGAMVGAMIATSLVVWPAAPLFLFMHGKDINVAKGTPITAFVEGDCTIDAKAWQRYNNPTPVSARVAAPVPNVQPVGPAPIAAQSSVYGVVVTPGAETESVADAARRYRAEKAKQQDNGGQQ